LTQVIKLRAVGVTEHFSTASHHCMKIAPFLVSLAALAFLLGGCAENSPAPGTNQAATPSIPANPDNPPVTMSGYVDTSTTAQIK
jgi:PBP1b-binding outer membrane lipoprotein LpoB